MSVTRRVVAAIGVLGAVLAGCGSDVPEGWRAVTLDGVSFAHPDGWGPLDDDALTDRWVSGASDAAGGAAAEASVELVATGELAPARYADVATTSIVANAQLVFPEFAITGVRQGQVAGADSVEVTSFTYRTDTGQLAEGAWIVAADAAVPYSAALQVTASELDRQLIRDIEATMRLTGLPPGGDPSLEAGATR